MADSSRLRENPSRQGKWRRMLEDIARVARNGREVWFVGHGHETQWREIVEMFAPEEIAAAGDRYLELACGGRINMIAPKKPQPTETDPHAS